MLELNASNDRGIDVVRNQIKMFANQKVTLPLGRHKIIILDEADRYNKYCAMYAYSSPVLYIKYANLVCVCACAHQVGNGQYIISGVRYCYVVLT